MVVVSVASDTTELDAARTRAEIGKELEADAVSPEDARAAGATGRIDVSIDRATRRLVVSYRGSAASLVRRVDLPGDPDAISREAVLLAGNLARDEAGELAAALRRPRPANAPADAPSPEDLAERAREERIRRVLADYAARDRSVRLPAAWTLLVVGAAGAGTSLYLGTRGGDAAKLAPTFLSDGVALGTLGVLWLVNPSPFERMSTYYEANVSDAGPRQGLREEMEQRWRKEADNAGFARLVLGIVWVSVGAAGVALDSYQLASESPTTVTTVTNVTGLVMGATFLGAGIVTLATEPDVEARLHEYERATGHPIELTDVGLRLTPTQGGVVAGLGGRF